MRRHRVNRRKSPPRQLPPLPKLPKLRSGMNLKLALVVPVVMAGAVVGTRIAAAALDRPVRSVLVEGTFQRVTPIQIEAALDPAIGKGFFEIDLRALKESVAAIEWVDTVELERKWPETLKVSITEHRAAASWGERGLLNTRGELFTEDARYEYPELPKLSGPPGSEQRVARTYLALRGRLADANFMLEAVRMDSRGAFVMELGSGQQVRFGRRELDARMDRFFSVVVPALGAEFERARYIDLRYPNGFAVGWTEARRLGSETLAEVEDLG